MSMVHKVASSVDTQTEIHIDQYRVRQSNNRRATVNMLGLQYRVPTGRSGIFQIGLSHLPKASVNCINSGSNVIGSCSSPTIEIRNHGQSLDALTLSASSLSGEWSIELPQRFIGGPTLSAGFHVGHLKYSSPFFDVSNRLILSTNLGRQTIAEARTQFLKDRPTHDRFHYGAVQGIWSIELPIEQGTLETVLTVSHLINPESSGIWSPKPTLYHAQIEYPLLQGRLAHALRLSIGSQLKTKIEGTVINPWTQGDHSTTFSRVEWILTF